MRWEESEKAVATIRSLRNRIVEVDLSCPLFPESELPVLYGWKPVNNAVTMLYDDLKPMNIEYIEYRALYWLLERLKVLYIF